MLFNQSQFRKEIISRLKSTRQHFADISDIVNRFIQQGPDAKKEVERDLVHMERNMKILDIKSLDPQTLKMDPDWLASFKKGDQEVSGLFASLTKDYFSNRRDKLIYYAGLILLLCILIFWAVDKWILSVV